MIKPLKSKKKKVYRPIEEALVDEKKVSKPRKISQQTDDDWGNEQSNDVDS